VIDWQALDMELERRKRDFERRMEETGGEICERLERVERCCKEAEEARREDWEQFKGRMMTAQERHRFELDGIRRTSARMTDEYVKIISAAREELEQVFAEGRAESRAQTDALFKLLDRLPPD
jgi:DNA anti-recombination protein RmuC